MSAASGSAADISTALGPARSGTAVTDVATRMLDLFTSGDLAPGTRLPPERQLATTLGVGRSAVREALAALEILGIVTVRPGSGTYLRGAASDLLPDTLRWGLLIGERSTRELVELRSGLEIHAVRLAAERATPEELEVLGGHLDRMRRSTGDLTALAHADLDFHHALAQIAGNTILVDLLHVARSLLQVYADRAVHDHTQALHAIEEHAAVHAALVGGDPDAAASAMAAHMATAAARVLAEAAG